MKDLYHWVAIVGNETATALLHRIASTSEVETVIHPSNTTLVKSRSLHLFQCPTAGSDAVEDYVCQARSTF